MTKNISWTIGPNLDAFNDVLRGGFGVFEYEEPVKLIWSQSNYSRTKLGWTETTKYIASKLKHCHPTNIDRVKADLELAEKQKGKTIFDLIVDIIKSHQHIELDLD